MGALSLTDKDPAQAAAALIQSMEINGTVNVHNGISEPIVVDNAWTPSNGGKIMTDCAIAMENVAHGYKKPNILDVKLGARLWADDAPPAKRAKLDKVASETTSKTLGFRVAGMRTWQGPQAAGQTGVNEDGYMFYDRDYGRALTADTVVKGFEDYFRVTPGTRPLRNLRKVIKRFIGDLEELQGVLEKEESRMYSASLLFVYEGDLEALQTAFVTEAEIFEFRTAPEKHQTNDTDINNSSHSTNDSRATEGRNGDEVITTLDGMTGTDADTEDDEALDSLPNIQNLKLIDFAHAKWTPGQGPDENLLHGIRNVIINLKDLLK